MPDATATSGRTRRLLVALAVAVALVAASTALAYAFTVHRYQSNLTRVHGAIDAHASDRPKVPTGVTAANWLVVGSDSRAAHGTSGRDAEDPLWRPGMQRTDTIMLVHLAGDGRHVSITSIPRDSWVHVPGHGMAKINAAFSYGGPALLVRTVERLTHIRIDHYAAIDFAGFKEMTNAVGGVTVEIPRTVHDSARGRTWTRGHHHLDGADALAYVRQRHGLPHGDLDRVRRQQGFLLALLAKVRSRGTLTHPLRLDRFLDATTEAVTVDDSLKGGELRSLALGYRDLGAGDLTFLTAPIRSSGWEGKQAVLYLDRTKSGELFTALRRDRVAGYVKAGGETNRVRAPN
ncbi:MAG: LCP family protein [Streptosporangiales bacterium]